MSLYKVTFVVDDEKMVDIEVDAPSEPVAINKAYDSAETTYPEADLELMGAICTEY